MPQIERVAEGIGAIVRKLRVALCAISAVSCSAAHAAEADGDSSAPRAINAAFEAGSGSLVLEVDDIDVTALADWTESSVVYAPSPPLEPGDHIVRVSRVTDAKAIVLSETTVSIDAPAGFSFEGELGADFQISQTLATRPKSDRGVPARTGLLGASAAIRRGGASFAANATSIYDSNGVFGSSRRMDLGDWSAAAIMPTRRVDFGLSLGTHDSGVQSLVVGPIASRGLTLSMTSKNQRLRALGFVRSATGTQGSRNVSGFGDGDNLIEGGSISAQLTKASRLEGVIYGGKRGGGSYGSAFEDPVATGDGWSIALDNFWLDNRLHARGEYARSSFDSDGALDEAAGKRDRAYVFAADYQALTKTLGDGRDLSLGFRGEYSSIGANFNSLANHSIAADATQLTVGSEFRLGGLAVGAQFRRATDNVSKLIILPTNRVKSVAADLTFQNREAKGLAALAWTLGFVTQRADLEYAPADFTPEDFVDNRTTTASIGVAGAGDRFGWSLSQAYTVLRDAIRPEFDSDDYVTQASVTWRVSSFQFQTGALHSYRSTPDGDYAALSPTASINGTLFDDRIALGASYGGNLAYRLREDDLHAVTASIGAVVLRQKGYFPGLTLNLGYSFNADSDLIAPRRQIFFGSVQIGQRLVFP